MIQVDDRAQITTCYDKSLLHNYCPYSYSCHKPSILGGDKIVYRSEGYGYLCTVTTDNELLKIKSEFTPSFPITVISPGHFEDQLGKMHNSYTLFHDSNNQHGYARFHYIQTKHRDILLPTVYKKCLSYVPVIKPDDNYQVHTMS